MRTVQNGNHIYEISKKIFLVLRVHLLNSPFILWFIMDHVLSLRRLYLQHGPSHFKRSGALPVLLSSVSDCTGIEIFPVVADTVTNFWAFHRICPRKATEKIAGRWNWRWIYCTFSCFVPWGWKRLEISRQIRALADQLIKHVSDLSAECLTGGEDELRERKETCLSWVPALQHRLCEISIGRVYPNNRAPTHRLSSLGPRARRASLRRTGDRWWTSLYQ